ncbi:MAG: YihY/virulence factor BrkB family protein [Gammaproteobacteria bacterium]
MAKRVFDGIGRRNLTLVSAGVAFYGMLAIFPALTALIAVYGLVADPADVQHLLNSGVLPPGVADLLHAQSRTLGGSGHGLLGIGVIIGFLLTFWSARQGATAILKALNIAYGRLETRSFLRRVGVSLALTMASIVFAVIALIAVVVIPALMGRLDFGPEWRIGITVIRWVILVLLIGCGLAILYRYVPNRNRPGWRWVACGSAAATILWLVGSALFSVYVGHFASYNRTYGTVGTVVVLLLWLFISALIVLLGAEANAAIEREAARVAATRDQRGPEAQ